MHIPKVQQIITPQCKIPLRNAEKTLLGRAKKAQELSNVFQKKLLNIQKGTLSFDTLKKMILDLDGLDKISLKIESLDIKDCGAYIQSDLDVYKSDNSIADLEMFFTGYTMKFKEKEALITNDNADIVHETRHLLDYLCFPKTILLSNPEQWLDKNKTAKFKEVHSFIMSPNVYKPKKILGFIKVHTFEKDLKEKIKDFDNLTAIRYLQKRRYQIQSEMNAYRDYMLYYARQILQNPELIIAIPRYYIQNKNDFEFPEKLRVIKKVIKELIQKERVKIKSA